MVKTEQITNLLSGFEIVPSDSVPYITLDRHKRFYINTSARRLLDAEPYKRMALAYNPETKSIAFIMDAPADVFDISISNYNIDKRYYMPARHFFKQYGFAEEETPYAFYYDRGLSDGSVLIFKLRQ